jgi:hypothetical protein
LLRVLGAAGRIAFSTLHGTVIMRPGAAARYRATALRGVEERRK